MVKSSFEVRSTPGGVFLMEDSSLTTGARYYVSSVSGSSAYSGLTSDRPLATINQAIAKCSGSLAEVIYVMPGHAESVTSSTALVLSAAGVSIIGLGRGTERPTITFATNLSASCVISAANVYLKNFLFVFNRSLQTIGIDVNASDFWIDYCELREGTKQSIAYIDLTTGAANSADRTRITNCKIQSPTAAGVYGIKLGEVQDSVVIRNNWIYGDFSTAAIGNPTGKVMTLLDISENYIENLNSGDWAIELVSACTGIISRNLCDSDALATCIDPGSCRCFENYVTKAVDTGGRLVPATT